MYIKFKVRSCSSSVRILLQQQMGVAGLGVVEIELDRYILVYQ